MDRKVFLRVGLAAVVVFAGWWFFVRPAPADPTKLTLYGNIEMRQYDVSFQVPGQVIKLNYEEGDLVKKGDVMAELDAADYLLQVQQAEAQIAQAKANLVQAQSTYQKYLLLHQQGAIADLSFESAQNTKNHLQSVYDATLVAKSMLERQNNYSKLIALEGGTVVSRNVEPGTVVAKNQTVSTLIKSQPVWIRTYVSEKDLGNVFYGMPATITLDSVNPAIGKPRTYAGHIGFISPDSEFTPKSVQTTDLRSDLVYRMRVYVEQEDEFLRQGMPVTVVLDLAATFKKENSNGK